MKKVLNHFIVRRLSDLLLSPFTVLGSIWFKYIRTADINKMPLSEKIFMAVGVLPVNDHYYQPLINPSKHLSKPLSEDRFMPGIDWNINEQLDLLGKFKYVDELARIPFEKKDAGQLQYYYNNHSYLGSDGQFFYNIIRHFKPRRIIEIGCGYSTMIAQYAHKQNAAENPGSRCEHLCIEPYEMPWLEQLEVTVIRKKVEDVEKELFASLQPNDILFIDSSHMVRPQGDVLVEFLEIVPAVQSGVLIHVHDIFSPRDYPKEWIVDKHCLWNEQYILESFLSFNNEFRIIGALNHLRHHFPAAFSATCPYIKTVPEDEPGAFWMIRN